MPNQNGDTVKVSDYLGKKTVVLFFFGATCADESTSLIKPYQERFAQFKRANVEVVGITVENVYAVKAFATELQTPFPLLSDHGIHFDKNTSRAYGAIEENARFASRFTIVIGKSGIIRHVEKRCQPGSGSPDFTRLVVSHQGTKNTPLTPGHEVCDLNLDSLGFPRQLCEHFPRNAILIGDRPYPPHRTTFRLKSIETFSVPGF